MAGATRNSPARMAFLEDTTLTTVGDWLRTRSHLLARDYLWGSNTRSWR